MRKVKVVLRGMPGSPIMFNKMLPEEGDDGPKGVTELSERQQAEQRFHREVEDGDRREGRIVITQDMLLACFCEAGKHFTVGKGKNAMKMSKSDGSSLVPGIFTILDPFFPIEIPDGTDAEEAWKVQKMPVTNKHTGGSRNKCRPRFDEWQINFTMLYDDDVIHEDQAKKIITKAGLSEGIGAFRANRRGRYGKFMIAKWADITDEESGEMSASDNGTGKKSAKSKSDRVAVTA